VVAIAGWGEYFPWSIPALYTGLAGNQDPGLGRVSYIIVILTSLARVAGTLLWWELADQTR
jgi:ABC-2 type transport system permease protein